MQGQKSKQVFLVVALFVVLLPWLRIAGRIKSSDEFKFSIADFRFEKLTSHTQARTWKLAWMWT
jgi:hypothetical protein